MNWKQLLQMAALATSTLLAACATAHPPAPSRMPGSARQVLDRAERSNWRIRVHADTVHEGRVLFLSTTKVRVARADLALADVTRIERAYNVEPSGAALGVGVGFAIGAIAGSAFAYSFSRGFGADCSATCLLGGGAAFGAMGGFIGGLIGDSSDPGPKDWAIIWQR
jgi:hypothetical protein